MQRGPMPLFKLRLLFPTSRFGLATVDNSKPMIFVHNLMPYKFASLLSRAGLG
jgi:hypothetical protein